ncbi:MAG: hypothetical protein HRF45_10470 [Fimbriimonadia bacterium]|jgi:hypothetical protein
MIYYVLGIGAVVWLMAWLIAFTVLRKRAKERIHLDGPARKWSSRLASRLYRSKISPAELASYSAMTGAEYVAAWAMIDPDVTAAADFSSTAEIHSGLDFAHYIHQHYESLDAAAKEGFLNRLVGYVGEQQAADLLAHQGHAVQVAAEANQPVWDLLVDGHPANIKTVADIAAIKGEAAANPGVTYYVPQDAHGEVGENIIPLPGFSHDTAKEATKEAIAGAKGEIAAHGLGMHLPWITFAFAAYRNYKLVRDYDQDPLTAVKHTAMESVGRGVGVIAGAKLGGALGWFLGPIGALGGAILVGIVGALTGGALAEEWKMQPLRKAQERFESLLETFGRSFANQLSTIRERVLLPYQVRRTAVEALAAHAARRYMRPRFWLWPDFYTVLLMEAVTAARSQLTQDLERIRPALDVVDRAPSGGWKQLGALMMNVPWLRQGLVHDESSLQATMNARADVFRERRKLNPSWTPPNLD